MWHTILLNKTAKNEWGQGYLFSIIFNNVTQFLYLKPISVLNIHSIIISSVYTKLLLSLLGGFSYTRMNDVLHKSYHIPIKWDHNSKQYNIKIYRTIKKLFNYRRLCICLVIAGYNHCTIRRRTNAIPSL